MFPPCPKRCLLGLGGFGGVAVFDVGLFGAGAFAAVCPTTPVGHGYPLARLASALAGGLALGLVLN